MKKTFIFIILFLLSSKAFAYDKIVINVSPYKIFSIKFNQKIDSKNDITNCVKILDSSGNKINTEIKMSNDKKTLYIYPPNGGYSKNQTYFLTVENLKSVYGKKLVKPISVKFSTAGQYLTGTYDVLVGGFTAYKKITIKNTNYNGAIKCKFNVSDKYYKIGETAELIIPKTYVDVYFFDENNSLLGKATLDVSKSFNSKTFTISQ